MIAGIGASNHLASIPATLLTNKMATTSGDKMATTKDRLIRGITPASNMATQKGVTSMNQGCTASRRKMGEGGATK